jgi:hypothetical protein
VEEEAKQKRERFAPLTPKPGLQSKEKLDAGWHEYRFKRVESQPGSTVIHLNERCSLVVAGLIMPVCRLGKIKPSGEMYERMEQWQQEHGAQRRDALP